MITHTENGGKGGGEAQESEGEGEGGNILEAGTARGRLGGDGRGGEPVGDFVADGPGRVVGASKGGAAVTAGRGVGIGDGVVVVVTRRHGLAHGRLAGPRARRLATIPVPRRPAGAGEGGRRGGGRQEAEERLGVHGDNGKGGR